MSKVLFSPARVWIISANTFVEAVRQKVFYFVLVLAVGLTGVSQYLRDFNFGSSELKFITDFGAGATVFFGSILAIVATAQLFFSEIENRTALTILAKPVLRSEFLCGKFLGIALVLLVFCAVMGALLGGILWSRESALMAQIPEQFPDGRFVRYGDLLWFAGTQWAKFCVIIAITILIASFSNTNLFTAALSFIVLIICHLQYLARDQWREAETLAGRVGAWLLGAVFPNFQAFNLGDQVALGAPIDPQAASLLGLYGLAYVAVFLALAVLSFRQREI